MYYIIISYWSKFNISEYRALAYVVWIIRFVYLHSIVPLEALNVINIYHTTSFVTLKLNDFLYCLWTITSSWRCSYPCWWPGCLTSSWSLWKMIDGLVSYLLNITGIRLKLLYLVLYLIHKRKLMGSFTQILFKSCFTGYDLISISIYSDIFILFSLESSCFALELNIILWVLILNIIVIFC